MVPRRAARATPGSQVLSGDEIGLRDDRGVGRTSGDDPAPGQVPPLHRPVPQPGVRRVNQVTIGALPVPHLPPGVTRVTQDRPDRVQCLRLAGAMRIAARVRGHPARDLRVVERAGDPGHAVPS